MGASYLSRPLETKISEDKCNKKLSFGVSSMQGWRIKQEVSLSYSLGQLDFKPVGLCVASPRVVER